MTFLPTHMKDIFVFLDGSFHLSPLSGRTVVWLKETAIDFGWRLTCTFASITSNPGISSFAHQRAGGVTQVGECPSMRS
jgi:hypothetical protein